MKKGKMLSSIIVGQVGSDCASNFEKGMIVDIIQQYERGDDTYCLIYNGELNESTVVHSELVDTSYSENRYLIEMEVNGRYSSINVKENALTLYLKDFIRADNTKVLSIKLVEDGKLQ